MKPANIDNLWPQKRDENWEAVYERIGIKSPSSRTMTTVDKREIWPYYNAAVICETDVRIAERWLSYETALRNWGPDNYFTGQVALAAVASQEQVQEMTERQNYPLSLRYYVPKDVELIHYQQPKYLLKTWGHQKLLKDMNIWEEIKDEWDIPNQLIRTLWDWGEVSRNRLRWIRGKYDTASGVSTES